MKLQAWDVSPNHCGAVEVDTDTGRMTWHSFVTDKPTAAGKCGDAFLLPTMDKVHKNVKSVARLLQLEHVFAAWTARACGGIAIEDYAHAAPQGAHYVGEAGGLARSSVVRASIPMRLYNVGSIKKFATGNGRAEKRDMIAAARKAGAEFDYVAVVNEDLSDAFALAQLFMVETWIREGKIKLSDLPKHQREVLARKDDDGVVWARPLILRSDVPSLLPNAQKPVSPVRVKRGVLMA